ncbi:MAG: CusA/CzcA family heavy metal efflux RND transporter [Candidatus Obscuribacterales bacterium]|nr:CusA/CzcA family heavy metal efflux RND transporter [Candidatus Obscuribacterales bacterium]
MIDGLIRLSIRQRFLVLISVLILIATGVAVMFKLPVDAVPDITNVQVQVLTSARTLAPLDVERQVTFPLEVGLRGLPGVTQVRSISKFGLSVITVIFNDSVDTYFARQLVLERLSQVKGQIPASVGTPELGPVSTGLGEIYQYELKSKSGSSNQTDLRTNQDWTVRRQLLGVPGVADINSYGGKKKQFQVRIDPAKLLAYKLSIRDVLKSVEANNENVGGAFIEHHGEQYVLRGEGLAQTPQQIGAIVIKTAKDGTPVLVRDVANVVTDAEVRQGAVVSDGQGETVAGIVMMLKGENTRSVVESVKSKVEQVKKTLPADVEMVPFYDRSELIDRTIHTVQSNLVEGAVLVVMVLLLVLGNWRAAMLVASVIPLSMLFAGICMNTFKVSGNLMSLGALDFGLIVDGAVVMVENAVRRLGEAKRNGAQEDRKTIIRNACLEVGRPVAFAVAIIAIVYVPLLCLSGIEGKLFHPMALTIVFALIGSLLLSLTYVPAMLTLILGQPAVEQPSGAERWLHSIYQKALSLVADNRAQTFCIASTLIFLSLATFPMLGSEFIPRLDEGALAIQMQQLPSVSLTESIATATAAERVLKSFPEVTKVVSKIGRAEVATDPMGVDTADMYVGLKPNSQWPGGESRDNLVNKLSKALQEKVPQAMFSFSQPVELRTAELIAGVRSDIAIKVFGDNLNTLKTVSDKVGKIVQSVPGATDVKVEQTTGVPQLIVTADREAIARRGINVADVNDVVESVVAGKPAGQIYQGDKRFDLVVRLDPRTKTDENSIKSLLVSATNDAQIPLTNVASVRLEDGPAQISREDGQRRMVIELNVRNRDIGTFVKDAQAKIERELKLPEGYYITWGGQFENLQRAGQTLEIVVPTALVLIFCLLFLTFGSVRQALLIFSGIPFAMVGGVLALALRGMPFSISAGVGLIALSGVAVLNGVVMVSYINSLRSKMTTESAAVTGALTRLRPVLMTAMVASLGFAPMAFSTSVGAEVQRPLATVVIGGLMTSSLLTLLLLPNLYVWFENAGHFSRRNQANEKENLVIGFTN